MSATEELRRLLDERGVEWSLPNPIIWQDEITTQVGHVFITAVPIILRTGVGRTASMGGYLIEGLDGEPVLVDGSYEWWQLALTPEQAIAATLGQGTCHNSAPAYLDFLCSKCGFIHYHSDANDTGNGNEWHFCPNCGRRIVDPTTNDVDAEVVTDG